MKIRDCPRCHKKGSLTFRYVKKRGSKYAYVKHYDPTKKSKTSWCYLQPGELLVVKFNEDWNEQYLRLIRKIGSQYRTQFNSDEKQLQHIFLVSSLEMMPEKFSEDKIWGKTWIHASKILETNGFPAHLVHDKVRSDLFKMSVLEAIGIKKEPLSKGSLIKVLNTKMNWVEHFLQAEKILQNMANSKANDQQSSEELATLIYEMENLNLKNKP